MNASVENSVTYTVLAADTLPQIFGGELGPDKGCFLYGRSFSPTVRNLARQVAALEATEAAYCCASGMAAISAALLNLCNTGDHIVASQAVYGGTHALLKQFLSQKCGIHTTFVDIADADAVAAAITPRTRVIYTESLSNPTLVVADIPALTRSAAAHSVLGQKISLVVDNTFSPMVMTPALLGADVVVHSLTKFFSGASDVMGGVVCSSAAFVAGLMDLHTGPLMLLGPAMDPRVASDLSLRLPHLGLRIAEHSRRALAFAHRLQALGAQVSYPGLPGHPQHELLKRLVNPGYGFGGLLTINVGSLAVANALMERLQNHEKFGFMAVSLGYHDTLMSASAASTSSELSDTELAGAGIQAGLVRMSVGLTGALEQRLAQLEAAWRWAIGGRSAAAAEPMARGEGVGKAKRARSWQSMASEMSEETEGGQEAGVRQQVGEV